MQVLKTIAGRIGDSTTNVQSTSPISNQDDNNDNNDNNEELASSSDDIDNVQTDIFEMENDSEEFLEGTEISEDDAEN